MSAGDTPNSADGKGSSGPRAVALGGGRGLQATLAALRRITDDITAVVTVADDGGSSGRLRKELGLLPPGDLRKALATLAAASPAEQRWAELFQHRFGGNGALAGHAVGNLVLAGLLEVMGDPVAVLDEACRLLGVRGRVLPMSPDPLDIEAEVIGLDEDPKVARKIRGQVAVASTPGRVQRVRLHNAGRSDEEPRACEEAVRAVRDADLVLLGPGSWFTSVLPHLLVPGLREAVMTTAAKRILVLNLVPQPGETAGFSPEQHLTVLLDHAPGLRVDAVVADAEAVPGPQRLRAAAAELGATTHLAKVSAITAPERHDPEALAACLRQAFGGGGAAVGHGSDRGGRAEARAERPRRGEEGLRWR